MPTINETITRYIFSGVSCMSAGFATNPIDVVKVRLQLDNELSNQKNIFKDRYYKGLLRGLVVILKDEGTRGLLKGATASVIREGIYSTIRLGSYEPVKELLGATDPFRTPLWKKILAGALCGAMGSAVANPTDLVKIRIQGQGPPRNGERPRYSSTFGAFREIYHEEGLRGLWRGTGPTMQRAAILTAAQIPSYDHIKYTFLNNKILAEGLPLHIASSVIAGFITAFVTSPVDVIKTRIMNQKVEGRKAVLYTSTFDCFLKTVRAEGIGGLYKGFIPNWMRLAPHTIITFLIFEQLRKLVGMRPV